MKCYTLNNDKRTNCSLFFITKSKWWISDLDLKILNDKSDKYTCFNCCYGNDKWRQIDRLVERFTLIDPVNEKQWRKNSLQTKVSLQNISKKRHSECKKKQI